MLFLLVASCRTQMKWDLTGELIIADGRTEEDRSVSITTRKVRLRANESLAINGM